MKIFDWRRTVITAGIVTAIAVILIGVSAIPSMQRELADHRNQGIKAIYSTGLISCQSDSEDIDTLLQKYAPGVSAVSINIRPAFFSPTSIRLVGNDLYYFVLDFPLYEEVGDPPYKLNTKGTPIIHHIRVSDELARELPLVVANDIRNARLAEPATGFDGTWYTFQASATDCACTWSPNVHTRAGHIVNLADQLAKLAESGGGSDKATSEQRVLAIIKSLQSR